MVILLALIASGESVFVMLSLGSSMFFRVKKSGARAYVQVVENNRVRGAVRQTVIANLGRADELMSSGALASLLASGAKFTDQVLLINALTEGGDQSLSVSTKRIGGPLLFGRIWERLGISDVLKELLKNRDFEFAVERAVFVATLHRLFVSGSDRDCISWMAEYDVPRCRRSRYPSFLSGHGLARRGTRREFHRGVSATLLEGRH